MYKWVFISLWNRAKSVLISWICSDPGRLFQNRGAAFLKARLPKELVADRGTSRSTPRFGELEECRGRTGRYCRMSSNNDVRELSHGWLGMSVS